jgi:AcrR family transcriptional regulator
MSPPDATRSDDARSRAARTKRNRTRRALLEAAGVTFSSQGWLDARMEDIAAGAGVSAATAYNHFPSKQALVSHVFAPLLTPQLERAERDIAADRPVVDALKDQVRALMEICFQHRRLTAAFCAAVQEYAIGVASPARPDDELDPLVQAPIAESIRLLVEHGQRTAQLRRYPPATDVSRLVTDLMLLSSVDTARHDSAAIAELLLTVMLGSLCPELLIAAGPEGRPFEVRIGPTTPRGRVPRPPNER